MSLPGCTCKRWLQLHLASAGPFACAAPCIAALSGTCLTSWPPLQCACCWLLRHPVGVQHAYRISCAHQPSCMLPAECPCMPVTPLTQQASRLRALCPAGLTPQQDALTTLARESAFSRGFLASLPAMWHSALGMQCHLSLGLADRSALALQVCEPCSQIRDLCSPWRSNLHLCRGRPGNTEDVGSRRECFFGAHRAQLASVSSSGAAWCPSPPAGLAALQWSCFCSHRPCLDMLRHGCRSTSACPASLRLSLFRSKPSTLDTSCSGSGSSATCWQCQREPLHLSTACKHLSCGKPQQIDWQHCWQACTQHQAPALPFPGSPAPHSSQLHCSRLAPCCRLAHPAIPLSLRLCTPCRSPVSAAALGWENPCAKQQFS